MAPWSGIAVAVHLPIRALGEASTFSPVREETPSIAFILESHDFDKDSNTANIMVQSLHLSPLLGACLRWPRNSSFIEHVKNPAYVQGVSRGIGVAF